MRCTGWCDEGLTSGEPVRVHHVLVEHYLRNMVEVSVVNSVDVAHGYRSVKRPTLIERCRLSPAREFRAVGEL